MASVKYYVYILVAKPEKLLVRLSLQRLPKHVECIEDAILPDEGDCGVYGRFDDAVEALRRIIRSWNELRNNR